MSPCSNAKAIRLFAKLNPEATHPPRLLLRKQWEVTERMLEAPPE